MPSQSTHQIPVRPHKVLHLVGDAEDAGGVLSVIRNLQSVSDPGTWKHVVWVNTAYQETRQPALDYRRSPKVLAESSQHWRLALHAPGATGDLNRLCQEESFDIIHAHSRGTLLVALLFAFRTGRPVIYTNHNYANSRTLYQWAAKRGSMHTVVLTENMANHYGLDTNADRIHQISACYDDAFLNHTLVDPFTLSEPPNPIRLVGVGSVIGWKKWDLVVEALHRLPEGDRTRFEFNIWGPTLNFPEAIAFEKSLRAKITAYGLTEQVHLRGATTDVVGQLRQNDLFLLPSTNEPCSVALMEALALGLPVIVSRSGGNVNIVKPGCGLTFEPDNPDSLKDTLQSLLTESEPFQAPAAIRDSVRSRCASQVWEAYQALYRPLIPASKQP